MREATYHDSKSTNLYLLVLHVCGLAKSELFLLKTLISFFLKLGRLDEQVIEAGREFQILGPW